MRQTFLSALAASLALGSGTARAHETVAKSKIVSVGVFKNGLALVQQEVQVPGAGTFRLDTTPNPVHGTFWIKSNCRAEGALKWIDFETPRPPDGLQDDLAGKEVVIPGPVDW